MERLSSMGKVSALLLIGVVIGIVLSFTTYVGVETTGSASFCGSCHTMKPFVESYEAYVHGGNNQLGLRSQCNDCHLPQDNLPHYLFTKARTGINDVWVEIFANTSEIDWSQRLKNPGGYVYDSGCLKCHSNLQDKSLSNLKAFLPHRAYFAKAVTQTCADCHPSVSHRYLAEVLKK